jgi:pimeloyl-ACP methyl ester carboxylesterase
VPSVAVAASKGRLRKVSIGVVALIVILCATGALYQIVSTWLDSRRFPQHGRSVNVGNFRLNMDCSGEGRPTVILESGLGVPAVGWFKVQPEVAKFTHVCSYDRAGYGWSDPGPEPRTSLQIARELKALLDAAGEKGPYVLVGHSFGGFNIRVFTYLYPNDVLGVVLVDASHEDMNARVHELLPDEIRRKHEAGEKWSDWEDRLLSPFIIHLGIERLQFAAGWGDWGDDPHLSTEFLRQLMYLSQQQKFRNATASEARTFVESGAQARTPVNFGDRPLIVLTAGITYDDPDPLLTKEQMEKITNLWINVLQVEEAKLSTRGKQIVVPDSTHMIPYQRPDAVVNAIHDVWTAVQ